MRTLAVIDGNSLIHRAFHAIQTPMYAPDGRPTNACFGFISMLLKLIADFKPDGIICAFDYGIPAFRLEAIELYKAQRPPTDPELKQQFSMIEKLLDAMGISIVRQKGWEGDDIIGTLATKAEAKGTIKTLLITGDKDALQLATDSTVVVANRTGMSDVVIYDPPGVIERFGVAPRQIPDYLGLAGDSSDNIPGVPGIGPKTAMKLLEQYGSIESVVAHAAEIKGKLGEKIQANSQMALDSRKVATIVRDVDIDIDLDAVVFPAFDERAVKLAFGELALNSQLRRFLSLAGKTNRGLMESSGAQGANGYDNSGQSRALNDNNKKCNSLGDSSLSKSSREGFDPGDSDANSTGLNSEALVSNSKHGSQSGSKATTFGVPSHSWKLSKSNGQIADVGHDLTQNMARILATVLMDDAALSALDDALLAGSCLALHLDGADSLPKSTSSQQSMVFSEKDDHTLYIALPDRVLRLQGELATVAVHRVVTAQASGSPVQVGRGDSSIDNDKYNNIKCNEYNSSNDTTGADTDHGGPERGVDAVINRMRNRMRNRIHMPAATNAKELLQLLVPRLSASLIDLAGIQLLDIRFFDLCIADYLLDSDNPHRSPTALMTKYLPGVLVEDFVDSEPGAIIAVAALTLHEILERRIVEDGSLRCFRDVEAPLVPVLVELEHNGIKVASDVLANQSAALTDTINDLRAQAYALAGLEFNLDSPKQVGEVLFEKLGLPPGKKTQRGYSTDAGVLVELESLSPLPGIILRYRELAKLNSTYLEALPRLIAADGHIHTSFNQTVAATGRLSSSEPNLQNIPVRSDIGRQIRTAFVADAAAIGAEQAVFVSADYSQIELRLLAHLSQDEHLIRAFRGGEDFHTETAARVFGLSTDQITPELRTRAKAVNFGIVYGQQAFGLSQSLRIGFGEAQEMIDRYFRAYPQVKEYLEGLKVQARNDGFVQTLFGRKRRIQEINSHNPNRRNFAERMAMNHPMQGTAADIIKLAMSRLAKELTLGGFRSQMVLQVHDELDFNCDVEELERLSALARNVMTTVVELRVPLTVDISSGASWAEAH